MLFPIFGAAGLALVWRGARMTEFREAWTPGDWVGTVTLALGVLLACGAYVAHRSQSWYIATTFFEDRMLDFGLWAAGALAIGLGVVPVVAGLASVVRPRDEAARPGTFALAFVTIVSVVCFGVYTAVKAAYLSTVFANLTLERNLIFLVPLLFAGTALFFERRGGRWWAVVAAGSFVLYLVRTTPYSLTQYPNYEAHGLAMIALANRILRWPADTIEHALVTVTIVVTAALALIPRIRSKRLALTVTATIAALTLAWTGTAEVYAAHGESLFSERFYSTLPKPANWLDRSTQGRVSDVPRPGRQGSKSGVPARVLEPLADEGMVARRDRAGSRRDRDARPQEPGWDALEPRHGLRARHPRRGYRRTTARGADRGIHAAPARRRAPAPNGPDRGLSRRLDGAHLRAIRGTTSRPGHTGAYA